MMFSRSLFAGKILTINPDTAAKYYQMTSEFKAAISKRRYITQGGLNKNFLALLNGITTWIKRSVLTYT